MNIWNIGDLEISRGGLKSSTSFANGSSPQLSDSITEFLIVLVSSENVVSASIRARRGSVFTKKPIKFSGSLEDRAAIGNPWIFNKQDRIEVSIEQVRLAMGEHLIEMIKFHGEMRGLRLFRKHTKKYISTFRLPRKIRVAILTCEKIEDFNALLDDMVSISEFEVVSKG